MDAKADSYTIFKTWCQKDRTIYAYSYTSKHTDNTCYGFNIESKDGTPQEVPNIGLASKEAVIEFVERNYGIEFISPGEKR